MRLRWFIIFTALTSCTFQKPMDVNNICSIINKHPKWYRTGKAVEKRFQVPVPVLFAVIHQESKFQAQAAPPRHKLFSLIPWNRPSTAYGYSQALRSTWAIYKRDEGGFFASRDNFSDAASFIGWYARAAHKRATIKQSDAYSLYLAYHEGVGGFMRKSYLSKPWLIGVARKVKARSILYQHQLRSCNI